jgi:hypothetical protein
MTMSALPNWLDSFFLPSNQGTKAVILPNTNYNELPENLAAGNLTYTGTLSVGRTIYYIPPTDGTDATSYVRSVKNGTSQTLTFTTIGGANVVSVAAGKTAYLIFEMAGARRLTGDV